MNENFDEYPSNFFNFFFPHFSHVIMLKFPTSKLIIPKNENLSSKNDSSIPSFFLSSSSPTRRDITQNSRNGQNITATSRKNPKPAPTINGFKPFGNVSKFKSLNTAVDFENEENLSAEVFSIFNLKYGLEDPNVTSTVLIVGYLQSCIRLFILSDEQESNQIDDDQDLEAETDQNNQNSDLYDTETIDSVPSPSKTAQNTNISDTKPIFISAVKLPSKQGAITSIQDLDSRQKSKGSKKLSVFHILVGTSNGYLNFIEFDRDYGQTGQDPSRSPSTLKFSYRILKTVKLKNSIILIKPSLIDECFILDISGRVYFILIDYILYKLTVSVLKLNQDCQVLDLLVDRNMAPLLLCNGYIKNFETDEVLTKFKRVKQKVGGDGMSLSESMMSLQLSSTSLSSSITSSISCMDLSRARSPTPTQPKTLHQPKFTTTAFTTSPDNKIIYSVDNYLYEIDLGESSSTKKFLYQHEHNIIYLKSINPSSCFLIDEFEEIYIIDIFLKKVMYEHGSSIELGYQTTIYKGIGFGQSGQRTNILNPSLSPNATATSIYNQYAENCSCQNLIKFINNKLYIFDKSNEISIVSFTGPSSVGKISKTKSKRISNRNGNILDLYVQLLASDTSGFQEVLDQEIGNDSPRSTPKMKENQIEKAENFINYFYGKLMAICDVDGASKTFLDLENSIILANFFTSLGSKYRVVHD